MPTILDQLTFSAQPSGNDQVANAKAALLKNLGAQLEAAKLMVEGKPSKLTERQKWFNRRDAEGNLLFCVRVTAP